MPVPRRVIKRVNEELETMFSRLVTRFFAGGDKQLRIGWSPYDGLGGIYRAAVEAQGGMPLKETEQGLLEIAEAYLDGVKARLKSGVLSTLGAAAKAPADAPVDIGAEITEHWDRATSEIERVVDTETQRARQVGSLDGISQASAAMGIEDPTVFWVVVRDTKLCGECRKLHLRPDGVTPRVWKLSEVSSGYHEKGEDKPSHQGLHPHCRCTMTFLPPGFGFRQGMIDWKGHGHDEYAEQNG